MDIGLGLELGDSVNLNLVSSPLHWSIVQPDLKPSLGIIMDTNSPQFAKILENRNPSPNDKIQWN